MTIYDIIEFITTMQRLLDKIYNFLLKASVQTPLANKEIKTKSELHFCFLFLN